jgi:hypothetical protein
LNHILKRINHSSFDESPVHRSKDSVQPSIDFTTVGRYFCGTAGTPWSECWYSNRFYINGKLFTISNPEAHFSVLEPKGGCGVSSRVSLTAQDFGNRTFSGEKPGCRVAINAGFFTRDVHVVVNTTTNETATVRCGTRSDAPCECLGNLVSQQRLIQSTSLQNVNFGLRDGAFVVGYLKENEVRSQQRPFDQLISGVIWLVRNGTNYVDIAAAVENPTTQQTSEVLENPNNHRANTFVDVFAARTIVGHDVEGRLKIFQLDGLHGRDRPTRGIDLRSLANILIELGFYSAVNLDGGGSSTTVQEDHVVSFPSDLCDNATPLESIRCERPVSSVICIHDAVQSTPPKPAPTTPTGSTTEAAGEAGGGGGGTAAGTAAGKDLTSPSPSLLSSPYSLFSTATAILSLMLGFSVSLHLGLWYVIGFLQLDVRQYSRCGGCGGCKQFNCARAKNGQYSKVEKQHLRDEDGEEIKEIEVTSF